MHRAVVLLIALVAVSSEVAAFVGGPTPPLRTGRLRSALGSQRRVNKVRTFSMLGLGVATTI